MAFTNLEREDAIILYVETFENVGLKVKLFVIADQPGIPVDRHHPDIFLAADDRTQRAAILAGLPAHRGEVQRARAFGQALREWRQSPGFQLRLKKIRL